MSDEIKTQQDDVSSQQTSAASRRRLLKLGAASVPMIVSLNAGSALAQTQMSMGVANCSVTIPGAAIDQIKTEADPGNPVTNSPSETYNGGQVYDILDPTIEFTGFDDRYSTYLDGLNIAGSGVSCVASIQMAMTTM